MPVTCKNDATLEEVLHFYTNGYLAIYPEVFGLKEPYNVTPLAKAMN